MNVLYKNIRLINPVTNIDQHIDLYVVNGIIRHCSSDEVIVESDNLEVIDSKDLVAAPGFIDIHVHLREPGFNYKETLQTGSMAAANGGFTEIVCMPNTEPAIDSSILVEYIKTKTASFPVKVHISAAITKGRKGEQLTDMLGLADSGAVYFTDDGACVSSAEVMKRAFEYVGYKDYLIAQHCEEHSLTTDFAMNEGEISMQLGLKGYPRVAEEIIVDRDIKLAKYLGNRRYHIQHLSTSGAVEIVRAAKSNGNRVSCEVTPHHLWFTDEKLIGYDSNFKMNPPLRKSSDISALIQGLRDKTIDCIASDHAPHSLEECEAEFEKIPNGVIGLETQLGAILTLLYHTHKFSLNDIISLFTLNPRKILGLPQVLIQVGEPANLTIFAPDKEWTVDKEKFLSKGRNTPFDKIEFKGKPEYIINNYQKIKSNL